MRATVKLKHDLDFHRVQYTKYLPGTVQYEHGSFSDI